MSENGYVECQMCGGTVRPLGALGEVTHGRCRSCGATQEMEEDLFDEDSEQTDWID